MNHSKYRLFLFLLGLSFYVLNPPIHAQNTENSPLSRYGLGDFRQTGPAWLSAIARSGAAFSSEQLFNPSNPASGAFLKQTDVEIGLYSKFNKLEDKQNRSFSEWTGGIQNVWLAIPLYNSINELLDRKKRNNSMSLQFGLYPYAGLGYKAQLTDSSRTDQTLQREVEGYGALTAFNVGFAYRYKNLSAGVGMDYIFGSLNYKQNLLFQSITGSYDSYLSDAHHIGAWRPQLGLIYHEVLNQDEINNDQNLRKNVLNFGLTAYVPTSYAGSYTALHQTRFDENLSVTDTILFIKDQESTGELPFGMKAGAMYSFQDRSGFMFSASYDSWKNRKLPVGLISNFENAFGLQFGAWWREGVHNYDPFFKKSTYRFGFYYQEDYRLVQGQQAYTLGVTAGWSYPILFLRQDAMIHLSVDAGQRKLGSILKENFVQINFGITINDNEWFLKRRYN